MTTVKVLFSALSIKPPALKSPSPLTQIPTKPPPLFQAPPDEYQIPEALKDVPSISLNKFAWGLSVFSWDRTDQTILDKRYVFRKGEKVSPYQFPRISIMLSISALFTTCRTADMTLHPPSDCKHWIQWFISSTLKRNTIMGKAWICYEYPFPQAMSTFQVQIPVPVWNGTIAL